MEFQIEDNIDIPEYHETIDFPFDTMVERNKQTGKIQSFRIGKEMVSKARYACKQYEKKHSNVEAKVCSDNKNLKEGEAKGDFFRVFIKVAS